MLLRVQRFPIETSPSGIVLHRGPWIASPDPMETTNPLSDVVPWAALRFVEAIDPWPRVRVVHDHGDVTFGPVSGAVDEALLPALAPEAFEREVEALIDHLYRAHAGRAVRPGWTAARHVEWERVAELPAIAREEGTLGDGAFRAGRRPVEELAIAVRSGASPIEGMLAWLASSPDRPWRDHPREVRLTEEWLYAVSREGRARRVPLASLRARLGAEDDDAIYVFGRRTQLVLMARRGCPVRAELERRLRA